ncbi:hypothetical protein [Helicobacter bilis]|uniref:hypothetical protein n=1 Tax=Helicobacter bilis TaxID=37372 RepID=UPI000B16CFEB|nr:hypothetical protein [Helicobacter bilis]
MRLDSNGDEIVWSIFFGFSIYHIYNTLFGMVCFYVTNSGIGFERRRLFGIQKKKIKFGEVEVSIGEYEVFVLCNHNEIFIAPPFFLIQKVGIGEKILIAYIF